MNAEKSPFHHTYVRAAGAVAYVSVVDGEGDEAIGSCFHIGNGVFVTARHVVENVVIREVATTVSHRLGGQAAAASPRRFEILDGPHFGPDDLDVAVFRVDLAGIPLPRIALSGHTEYDLEESDFVLSDVLILGYPPIPFTLMPVLVATLGQVNAVVRVRHSSASHFIASTMARGGFSGGVALDRTGMALALVTESLGVGSGLVETGYTSLLSITSAVDLAAERFSFSIHGDGPGRYSETLIGMRFARTATARLSSYVYDAHLFVYDDDRDVFITITCDDPAVLDIATEAFRTHVPLKAERDGPVERTFTPIDNPTPHRLVLAAEAARTVLIAAGYVETVQERSGWQLEHWKGPTT